MDEFDGYETKLYTISEIAEMVDVNYKYAANALKAGRCQPKKVEKRIKYYSFEAKDWVNYYKSTRKFNRTKVRFSENRMRDLEQSSQKTALDYEELAQKFDVLQEEFDKMKVVVQALKRHYLDNKGETP
jgi:hypothetical protein